MKSALSSSRREIFLLLCQMQETRILQDDSHDLLVAALRQWREGHHLPRQAIDVFGDLVFRQHAVYEAYALRLLGVDLPAGHKNVVGVAWPLRA